MSDQLGGGVYVDPVELSRYGTLDRGKLDGARAELRRVLKDQPITILFRQIATPSHERAWFNWKPRRSGFRPVIIEHQISRFSVHNSYQISLVTPRIVTERSRCGRAIMAQQKLVEHNSAEGRPLKTIVTASGENIVEHHHRRFLALMGSQVPVAIDLSELMSTASSGPSAYYTDAFKLVTGRVVLFEDFIVYEATTSFFTRIEKPAYEFALRSTGDRPKTIRLTLGHRDESSLWNAYPAAMIDCALRLRRVKDVFSCVH